MRLLGGFRFFLLFLFSSSHLRPSTSTSSPSASNFLILLPSLPNPLLRAHTPPPSTPYIPFFHPLTLILLANPTPQATIEKSNKVDSVPMADNTPTSDGNFIPDDSSMNDSNAMFGDFFELDLLDPADSNSDLFSFLLNNEDFNAVTNSPSGLSTDSLLDLSTLDGLNNFENLPLLESFPNQEDTPAKEPVKAEELDLRFLLAHNMQQQQEQQAQVQAQATSTTATIDNSSLVVELTTPAELPAPPQNLATPATSPATPTMKVPEASISAAAATAQSKSSYEIFQSSAVFFFVYYYEIITKRF